MVHIKAKKIMAMSCFEGCGSYPGQEENDHVSCFEVVVHNQAEKRMAMSCFGDCASYPGQEKNDHVML